MSGDLEDFLRRAAQRRQAKAAQQPQPPAPRQRPQYSSRSTERVVDAAMVEEPLTAEIVEAPADLDGARQNKLQEARRAAAAVESAAAARKQKVPGASNRSRDRTKVTGVAAQDLIRLLSQPGGINQAILLREILDRPTHRW